MSKKEFTNQEIKRYEKHLILDELGYSGQLKLLNSKILIIGAGGLGSPVALYLASAGIGTIGIADGDNVDLSNLQRQIIHFTKDIGISKVNSAKEKMKAINPNTNVITYNIYLNKSNIIDIVSKYDFIIDCCDNFATKFLINEACVLTNKPFSHGGIFKFTGQTMTILPKKSACYACIFDSPPPKGSTPSCSTSGILGTIPGILGTIQATEAIKYITNCGQLLTNQLLTFDALNMDFRKISLEKNNHCKICSKQY